MARSDLGAWLEVTWAGTAGHGVKCQLGSREVELRLVVQQIVLHRDVFAPDFYRCQAGKEVPPREKPGYPSERRVYVLSTQRRKSLLQSVDNKVVALDVMDYVSQEALAASAASAFNARRTLRGAANFGRTDRPVWLPVGEPHLRPEAHLLALVAGASSHYGLPNVCAADELAVTLIVTALGEVRDPMECRIDKWRELDRAMLAHARN